MKLVRLATLVVATVLLAGCGGGGDSGGSDNGVSAKSADQIVADATAAAKSASSVYVHGSTASGSAPLEIDMHLVAGKGGAGQLTANGQTFEIVRRRRQGLHQGRRRVLEADRRRRGRPALPRQVARRSVDRPGLLVVHVADRHRAVLRRRAERRTERSTKGDETTINGTPAIAVEDTSKDGTLYVATEGDALPAPDRGRRQGRGHDHVRRTGTRRTRSRRRRTPSTSRSSRAAEPARRVSLRRRRRAPARRRPPRTRATPARRRRRAPAAPCATASPSRAAPARRGRAARGASSSRRSASA